MTSAPGAPPPRIIVFVPGPVIIEGLGARMIVYGCGISNLQINSYKCYKCYKPGWRCAGDCAKAFGINVLIPATWSYAQALPRCWRLPLAERLTPSHFPESTPTSIPTHPPQPRLPRPLP